MSRFAVMPPKRLVMPVTDEQAHAARLRDRAPPQPLADPGRQPLGREPHHHDERGAVDDQIDPDEAGSDAPEARAQVRLQRENERGAEEGPERRADAAEDRGQGEAHGEVDREDVERIHEAHVLRPERAAHRGERRADRDGRHLQPNAPAPRGTGPRPRPRAPPRAGSRGASARGRARPGTGRPRARGRWRPRRACPRCRASRIRAGTGRGCPRSRR